MMSFAMKKTTGTQRAMPRNGRLNLSLRMRREDVSNESLSVPAVLTFVAMLTLVRIPSTSPEGRCPSADRLAPDMFSVEDEVPPPKKREKAEWFLGLDIGWIAPVSVSTSCAMPFGVEFFMSRTPEDESGGRRVLLR